MDDTVKKILSCMKRRNITDKQLTKDIGINKSAVTDWKTGKTKSYKKYIDKIAEYLGVSVDYLLGRTDDPLPKIQIQDKIMVKGDYVGPVNPAEKQWLEAALAAYREALQYRFAVYIKARFGGNEYKFVQEDLQWQNKQKRLGTKNGGYG